MAKMGYHEARMIVAKTIKKRLDSMVTNMLVDISGDSAQPFETRMAMIEAIPSVYSDLIEKLDWNIEYHQEQMEKTETEEGET